MKRFILSLKNNGLVYAFLVIGILFIIFPEPICEAVPYILGILFIAYAAAELVICLGKPDSKASLGDAITKAVIGAVLLFMRADSIAVIGIIWGVMSLKDAAEEIDEMRKNKKAGVVSIVMVTASIVLAALLIINPFGHFATHVRLMGLVLIVTALIRIRRGSGDAAGDTAEKEEPGT